MIPAPPSPPSSNRPSPSKPQTLCGENPLVHVILAFWALWHCRHARPPDTSLMPA